MMCAMKKGVTGRQALKNMEIDSRMNVTRLVNFGQCSSQMAVIQKRLGSNSVDSSTLTMKLPVLPHDRWLRDWMQNTIVKQIMQRLLKGRAIMMMFIDLKQKNVNQYMANVSKWFHSLTIAEDEV